MDNKVIDFLKSISAFSGDVKNIINTYRFLEKKYSSMNEQSLLKDLENEKKVIFSYLKEYKNLTLKQIKSFINELEESYIDLNEFSDFYQPQTKINFIKISSQNGVYGIQSDELSNQINVKNKIYAMKHLQELVPRLTAQEAMNALNHADYCGRFCIAKDFADIDMENRYIKEPTTQMGKFSENDSVMTPDTPVSRQFASEGDEFVNKSLDNTDENFDDKSNEQKLEEEKDNIYEGNVYVDESGNILVVTAIDNNSIILANNDVLSKQDVEQKIKNGVWKRQSSDQEIKQILKKMEKYANDLEEKLIIESSIKQMVTDLQQNLESKTREEIQSYDTIVNKNLDKIKKLAASIEEIIKSEDKSLKLYKIVKEKFGNVNFTYTPEYSKTIAVDKKTMNEILEQMKKLVAPRNIEKFEVMEKQLYKFSTVQENIKFSLNDENPEVRERVQDKIKELQKGLKSSKYCVDVELDNDSYDKLDKMLCASKIDFNIYNSLANCIGFNSSLSNDTVNKIYNILNNDNYSTIKITAGNILQSIKSIFSWIMKVFGFVVIQESESKKLENLLNKIV